MFRRSAIKKPQSQLEQKGEVTVFTRKEEPVKKSEVNLSITSKPTLKLHVSTNPNRIYTTVCMCILLERGTDTYLNPLKENISFLQSLFDKTFIVFVAHDVEQETLDVLDALEHSLLIKTDSELEYEQRNLYLKFVHENRVIFNSMMVIDPKVSLTLPLNKSSFDFISKIEFNVAFSNQTYKYYDIESLIEGSKHVYKIEDAEAKTEKIKQYQKHISRYSDLIPVQSAFGGLAIYNMNVLDNDNKYTTDNHISFNLTISKKYSRMYIVPSFLIETSPNIASLYVR